MGVDTDIGIKLEVDMDISASLDVSGTTVSNPKFSVIGPNIKASAETDNLAIGLTAGMVTGDVIQGVVKLEAEVTVTGMEQLPFNTIAVAPKGSFITHLPLVVFIGPPQPSFRHPHIIIFMALIKW